MSKESYIRGFCKAAEARGVDPRALAKFASGSPVYKTDGWAPSHREGTVPSLGLNGGVINNRYVPYPESDESMLDLIKHRSPITYSALTEDGKYRNWWLAHLKSLGRAQDQEMAAAVKTQDAPNSLWNRLKFAISGNWPTQRVHSDEQVNQIGMDAYHSSMSSLTGTPTRVSAPVKK